MFKFSSLIAKEHEQQTVELQRAIDDDETVVLGVGGQCLQRAVSGCDSRCVLGARCDCFLSPADDFFDFGLHPASCTDSAPGLARRLVVGGHCGYLRMLTPVFRWVKASQGSGRRGAASWLRPCIKAARWR